MRVDGRRGRPDRCRAPARPACPPSRRGLVQRWRPAPPPPPVTHRGRRHRVATAAPPPERRPGGGAAVTVSRRPRSPPSGERAQGGAEATGAGWSDTVVAPAGLPIAQLAGGVGGELGAQGAGDVPAVAKCSARLTACVLRGERSRPAWPEARGEHRPVLGRFTRPLAQERAAGGGEAGGVEARRVRRARDERGDEGGLPRGERPRIPTRRVENGDSPPWKGRLAVRGSGVMGGMLALRRRARR